MTSEIPVEFRHRLLRQALAFLALPADEQVRVNGPGCVACDLLGDFDNARRVIVGNDDGTLTDEQLRLLNSMDSVMREMKPPDIECFNNEVLHRPVWQELREIAADTVKEFGSENYIMQPFVEVQPGVWRRLQDGDWKVI